VSGELEGVARDRLARVIEDGEAWLPVEPALAEVGLVHRDVNPENIMVSEEETERPHLTLIDFGYAALLGGGDAPNELTGVAGSPEYAAPEVLSWIAVEAGDAGEEEGEPYDAGCDVWSVGVTAYVLLCAELPSDLPEEATKEALIEAALSVDLSFPRLEGDAMVRRGEVMGKLEGEAAMVPAREFVRACMTVDRHDRPSALQLLEHPWFGGQATTTLLEEGVRVDEVGEVAPGSAAGHPEVQAGTRADAPVTDAPDSEDEEREEAAYALAELQQQMAKLEAARPPPTRPPWPRRDRARRATRPPGPRHRGLRSAAARQAARPALSRPPTPPSPHPRPWSPW
jgi:serine/threonine protein kinase